MKTQRQITRKETKERRKHLTPHTYELKVDESHMSKADKKHITELFREAKYLNNNFVTIGDFNLLDDKVKEVPVKVIDHYENRPLNHLSAQMKQSIKERHIQNILNLAAKKEKGQKVGKIKHKKHVNSIPLKQHGKTFTLLKNKVKIQGLKHKLRVRGMKQIPEQAEIAGSKLVRKPSGLYVHVTAYHEPMKKCPNCKKEINANEMVCKCGHNQPTKDFSTGIDLGIGIQVTTKEGITLEYSFPVPKEIRKLDRKIMKKNRPDSNNKYNDKQQRRKAYEKLTNIKQDTNKKIAHVLKSNFKYVVIQDDPIRAWQKGLFGKKVQNTAIGVLKKILKQYSPSTVVSQGFPSTQECPECNELTKHELSDRIFTCSKCGYKEHRDWKAAICINEQGLKQLVMDRNQSQKLGEGLTSVEQLLDEFRQIKYIVVNKLVSLSQEAHDFSSG